MELKKRTNDYNHDVVDCPFCSEWQYVEDQPNPAKRLHSHITTLAKKEAFLHALENNIKTPHLDYYIEHTSKTQVITLEKRIFDSDIVIK